MSLDPPGPIVNLNQGSYRVRGGCTPWGGTVQISIGGSNFITDCVQYYGLYERAGLRVGYFARGRTDCRGSSPAIAATA